MRLHELERRAWLAAQRRDQRLSSEPERRRAQGIVHTPPELARGVVRVLDELLQRRYGLPEGIADASLHFIDPACGPGAFFAALLALADERGVTRPLRLTGFDLDPEALGLASELRSHPAAARLELIEADLFDPQPLLELARGSSQRLVLLGNPPWTSARAVQPPAAQHLLEDFRRDDAGERLQERKIGVLADAYVRFFRLCAEAARDASAGALVGLVTNASFLDGPVHRGMRAALLRWFDALYILDLGGSALLGRAPGGARDENVFGVRPSVSISWLCRDARPSVDAASSDWRSHGRAGYYARWSGERASKLARIADLTLEAAGFVPLDAEAPARRFVPTRRAGAVYSQYLSLAECFPFQREGVQTNRDAAVIDQDRERLLERLRAFAAGHDADWPELGQARRELSHYSPALARTRVGEALERDPDGSLGISVQRIAYRPFDLRWFCPVAPLCHRPRAELLAALAHAPSMLVSVRKDRGSAPWTHFAASAAVVDNCFLSARSSCRARAFPATDPLGTDNLSEAMRERLGELLGQAPSAQSFLHYALCVLAAASYRVRYDEELHRDYPRIPLPPTAADFGTIASLGQRLSALFAEPIGAGPAAVDPPPGLFHDDLVVDSVAGSLRVGRQVLIPLDVRAAAARIGHHNPLGAYIAARRDLRCGAAELTRIAALAARLSAIADLLEEVDIGMQGILGVTN